MLHICGGWGLFISPTLIYYLHAKHIDPLPMLASELSGGRLGNRIPNLVSSSGSPFRFHVSAGTLKVMVHSPLLSGGMLCSIRAVVESSIPLKRMNVLTEIFRIIRDSASSVVLSEITDYFLVWCRNHAGIVWEISTVLSGKYFLQITETSHLSV